jgi:prepilin-type N-terminal cleavage/methylation domain-containing protein
LTSGESAKGFTLVELLVAMVIVVAVMAAVLAVIDPVQVMYRSQPEMADMHQRLRVVADTLTRALGEAGRGVDGGAIGGPLVRVLPPVMPYRVGDVQNDTAAGVFYRPDSVSVLGAVRGAGPTTVARVLTPGVQDLEVEVLPNCADVAADFLCGVTPGLRVLLYDVDGRRDVVTVTSVLGRVLQVHKQGGLLMSRYDSGHAQLVPIELQTFSLKTNAAAATYQLMHDDGRAAAFPVADNVVGLRFRYLGAATTPALTGVSSLAGPSRVETTYGPHPPRAGTDDLDDAWPAGENCVIAMFDGVQVPRLDVLGGGRGLAELTPAQLTDGPWCPDAASPDRFDADLLRIRRIRVEVRVQAAQPSFRGPAGALFAHAGVAVRADQMLPDQMVDVDVTPPNLQVGP